MKVKIGIFGKTNAGKSTLLNALTGQDIAIVSPQRGTTTDPVRRAYELLDYGIVTFIDTAGIDDSTTLGDKRIAKSQSIATEVDLALFLLSDSEIDVEERRFCEKLLCPIIYVRRGYKVEALFSEIRETLTREVKPLAPFYGSALNSGEVVLLVCPIDSEAPAGRLILPQVAAIRAALDIHSTAIVVQVDELGEAIERYSPNLVVTDSQAFKEVEEIVRGRVSLTSFSILLAAQRGDIELYSEGLKALRELKAGSRVLLIEHCSHGVSCEDIGRVKIPRLLRERVGGDIEVDILSGRDPLPDDLSPYSLAIQCGGCMVGARPIIYRAKMCQGRGVPITNYGMALRELLVNSAKPQ